MPPILAAVLALSVGPPLTGPDLEREARAIDLRQTPGSRW